VERYAAACEDRINFFGRLKQILARLRFLPARGVALRAHRCRAPRMSKSSRAAALEALARARRTGARLTDNIEVRRAEKFAGATRGKPASSAPAESAIATLDRF
jgi:hypothetical protein